MNTTDTPPPAPAARDTMAGKPVLWRPAKTVLNMTSGFEKKLLCDGPTFSLGDACVYKCAFCYVTDMMAKASYMPHDKPHSDIVVRRENALDILYQQLTTKAKNGVEPPRKPKYDNANDNRVVYSSPLVDVAANIELMNETVDACVIIMQLTSWKIRLLSKSNLLPMLARKVADRVGVEEAKARLLLGVSTGTLDDSLAEAFELGCPLVSRRLSSLYRLQDDGWNTYGMICPSLPQRDYMEFSQRMANALRIEHMTDIWAEVMNVRGESMVKTCAALRKYGYGWEADQLEIVEKDKDAWEEYSRLTFEAHAITLPGRLKFLQYVTKANRPYWEAAIDKGAVLL